MSDILEVFQNRRSVRRYTDQPISDEDIKKILQAGLMSASGKSKYPAEFIVIKDKETLNQLSGCRVGVASMLAKAACAIAVVGDTTITDTVIEDCSIAMANMHLMASSMGIGSCWIQGRVRQATDGRTTEEFARDVLGFPETYQLQAILSLGYPDMDVKQPRPHSLERLKYEKIHQEKF